MSTSEAQSDSTLLPHTKLPIHAHDPNKEPTAYCTNLRNEKKGDGKERRVELSFDDPLPYRWICKIKILNQIKDQPVTISQCPCLACESDKLKLGSKNLKYTPESTDLNGVAYGTGFLVNIPQSQRCVILTAAHNLTYKVAHSTLVGGSTSTSTSSASTSESDKKVYLIPVAKIVVTFPGRAPMVIDSTHYYFPPTYTCRHIDEYSRSQYDYGVIVLPGLKHPGEACGFGFTATLTDRELLGAKLSIFGYPVLKDTTDDPASASEPGIGELPAGLNTSDNRVLYGSGGDVQSVGPRIIRYFVNTSGGQSGCPVYLWDRGYYTVVGIHSQFERLGEFTVNAASRIRVGMLQNIFTWLHRYDINVLRSSQNSATTGGESTTSFTDFVYPFWHVVLYYQDISNTKDNRPRVLEISEQAPKDPTKLSSVNYTAIDIPSDPNQLQEDLKRDQAIAKFAVDHKGSQIGILPVNTFSEGHQVNFSQNLWVISSLKYEDTFITFDIHTEEYKDRVAACSRYQHTPILPRALELVTMVQDSSSATKQWQIIPLRYSGMLYPPGRQSPDNTKFLQRYDGFNFQKITMLKVGDEDTPSVIDIPDAKIQNVDLVPLLWELGIGLVGALIDIASTDEQEHESTAVEKTESPDNE